MLLYHDDHCTLWERGEEDDSKTQEDGLKCRECYDTLTAAYDTCSTTLRGLRNHTLSIQRRVTEKGWEFIAGIKLHSAKAGVLIAHDS